MHELIFVNFLISPKKKRTPCPTTPYDVHLTPSVHQDKDQSACWILIIPAYWLMTLITHDNKYFGQGPITQRSPINIPVYSIINECNILHIHVLAKLTILLATHTHTHFDAHISISKRISQQQQGVKKRWRRPFASCNGIIWRKWSSVYTLCCVWIWKCTYILHTRWSSSPRDSCLHHYCALYT